MNNNSQNKEQIIKNLLESKELKIKALTSAGIITGTVIDIIVNSSEEKKSKFLNISSNEVKIKIEQNYPVTYMIENARLYSIANLKEFTFLDFVELNSSHVIALCPLFEEVD